MSLRVVTHCDTLLLAEAADHGAVDVDRMLVYVSHLEPSAVEPAHDLVVALQTRALEEIAEGALRSHAAFPIEYLTDELVMTTSAAVCQTFGAQEDADDEAFDDRTQVVGSLRAPLG